MSLVLLKLPEVLRRRALQPTSHYADVKNGMFTPPVKLSSRTVAWPEYEVEELNAARIAGADEHQIKALVRKLVKQREDLMPKIEAA